MTMQNPDKPILAKDLNDYHNKILPYLGGMPEVLANKFARGDLYDTNERMIGKWIDGKPLYQKTIDLTGHITRGDYPHGISNVDCIFISEFFMKDGSNSIYLMDQITQGDSRIRVDDTNITLYLKTSDWYTDQIVVVLKYTKTTDSANSFNIGSDTDYSTDEKIVGTWIDGSYIYQKTIVLPSQTINSGSNFIPIIDGSDKVLIQGYGYIKYNDAEDIDTIPFAWSNNIYNYVGQNSQKKIGINMRYNNAVTADVIITIQYTKTS